MIYLFYLLIAVLPLENHWLWRFELVGSFTVLKALGFLCLCGALASLGRKGFNRRLLESPALRLYVAYLAIQISSYVLHGGDLDVDIGTYLNVLSILLLAIVTLTLVDSPVRLRRTLLLGIGGAAFASLYTIRGQQGAPSTADFRPSGIFEDANYYALVVGLWIPLAYLWSFGNRPKKERIFCFGCLTAMLLGTTFAASRGGFLGLATALLFMVWHSRRRLRNCAIVIGATVPLLLFSPSSPLHRFLKPRYGDDRAREARLIAWTAGLRMVRAHPLAGVGLGNFKPLIARYETSDKTVVTVAHNTYVETAAELGLPALFIHVGMLVATFLSLGRTRRHAAAVRWDYVHHSALGLQAGILSYIVGAFFVSTWWQKLPWLVVFISICLDTLARKAIVQQRQVHNGSRLEEVTAKQRV